MAALIKIDHSFASSAGRAGTVSFCSRCGEPGEDPPRTDRAPFQTRVCQLCGMGLLLRCTRAALPGAGAAFLIATADLRVSAVSGAAEVLFGLEQTLLGTSLLDVVASPTDGDPLARAAARAALRSREPVVLPVRGVAPKARKVGMLAARVSTCGPPRAALVTVEPSGFRAR